MMCRHRVASVFVFATCLAAIFAGLCQAAPAPQDLVGRWVNDRGDWIEFFPDQTYAAKSGDMNVNGKWLRLSGGRVKMELLLFEVVEIILGEVKDDVLTTNFNGKIRTWRMADR